MKIKYKISFKLRAYGRKVIKYLIRARFTFNNQRADISTGWSLDNIDYWDAEKEMVKSGYAGTHGEKAGDINRDLQRIRENLEMSFSYFEANDLIPDPSEVISRYKLRMGGVAPLLKEREIVQPTLKTKEPDFFSVFNEFQAICGEKNSWTKATYDKMHSLEVDLREYQNNIRFSDISDVWLTNFVIFLRDKKKLHTPRKEKGEREEYDDEDIIGLKNSTIAKKLGYFKWFLNWATKRNYNTNLSYVDFDPKLKKTQNKIVYLNKEELHKIIQLQLPEGKEHLDAIRDVFLFCCFSGIRHSDAINLRASDIKWTSSNPSVLPHIEITTVKTADSIIIELNEVTSKILKKYQNNILLGGKALPVIKNQPMNRELKELCKLAGIDEEVRVTSYKGNQRKDEVLPKWKLVGTHTGRRTFVVNCLSMGIAPNIVMKWTGHSSYSSMRPYVDVVDKIKAEEMKKLNSIL